MAEAFHNPYNFVPFGEDVKRIPALSINGHDTLAGAETLSGFIQVQLITLTRLAIANRSEGHVQRQTITDTDGRTMQHRVFTKFPDNGAGDKIIPSSTLKGALRVTAETLGNGCVSIFNGLYRYQHYNPRTRKREKIKVDHKPGLPPQFAHHLCSITDKWGRLRKDPGNGLCITCRLFGTLGTALSRFIPLKHPNAFAGKVSVSDARLLNPETFDQNPVVTKELGHPKPHHLPFYVKEAKLLGRKFYFHQGENETNYKEANSQPKALNLTLKETVLQGGKFQFTVQFKNLSREEFGLLCWAIDLDGSPVQLNSLAHKIGLGKSIGMGSVKMRIAEIVLFDSQKMYSMLEGFETVLNRKADNFNEKLQEYKSWFAPNAFENKKELLDILTFAKSDVHYPDRQTWFRRGHGRTPLRSDGSLPPDYEPRPKPAPREQEPAKTEQDTSEQGAIPPRRPRRFDRTGEQTGEERRREPRKPFVKRDRGRDFGEKRQRASEEQIDREEPQREFPEKPAKVESSPMPVAAESSGSFPTLQKLHNLQARKSAAESTSEVIKIGSTVRGAIESIDGDKVTMRLTERATGIFQKPLIQLQIGDQVKVKVRHARVNETIYDVEFSRKLTP